MRSARLVRSAGAAALTGAATGVAAAATALAVTEVVGVVLDRDQPTVVSTVASRLVDVLSGPLREPAIDIFGHDSKRALIVGIVIVALAAGALLGILGMSWPWAPVLGLSAFGVLGVWAAHRDPLASTRTAVVAVTVGVICGESVRRALVHVGPGAQEEAVGGRRQFVLGLGATALVVAAALGVRRRLLQGQRGLPEGALPTPARVTPVPATEPVIVPGLVPYLTPNERFYRIDTAIFVPQVDASTWTLSIEGMVDRPRQYTYDELLSMPCVEEPVTLACISNDVGGHLISNARWLGVPLADLLVAAGVRPDATQIVGRAVDGFTVDLSTAATLDGRVAMVALGMNGVPLPREHGFPARLVVAGFYGYASATKWLSALELTRREDHDSFWVSRGWDKDGPIKLQSRIDVPSSGQEVPAGPFRIAGVAWVPPVGIAQVEVQLDRGPWRQATLGATASGSTWVQWYYDWADAQPGSHIWAVRATDRLGNVQTEVPNPPEPSGATGYHYRGFKVV